MFDIIGYSEHKGEKSFLSPGFKPGFHVIFHGIWFFNTNKDVKKNIRLQKFGNDELCFSKVTTSLQGKPTDCNPTVKRLQLRFFLGYVPNTSCEEKVYGQPAFSESCGPVVHRCQFYKKTKLVLGLSVEATKIMMYYSSLVEDSFQLSCGFNFCFCNLIKNGLQHRTFPTWVLQNSSFESSENFL